MFDSDNTDCFCSQVIIAPLEGSLLNQIPWYIHTYFGIKVFAPSVNTSEPFYIDPTLVKINWTDSNDGWNDFARLYWTKAMIIDHYQRKIMPKFTKLGYAKMKIPEKLLDVILQEKSKNSVPEGVTRNSRIPISSVVYAYEVSTS